MPERLDAVGSCVPASKSDNIHKHIDFYLRHATKPRCCAVDVKGRKALERGGQLQHEFMLVETKNVRGMPGWARGRAHIIAQRVGPSAFCLLDRARLEAYMDRAFKGCKPSTRRGVTDTLLSREGRLDEFAWVSMETLVIEAGIGVVFDD